MKCWYADVYLIGIKTNEFKNEYFWMEIDHEKSSSINNHLFSLIFRCRILCSGSSSMFVGCHILEKTENWKHDRGSCAEFLISNKQRSKASLSCRRSCLLRRILKKVNPIHQKKVLLVKKNSKRSKIFSQNKFC